MSTDAGHILQIATENDSLPGAKVGGVADVIRDIASALAGEGARVTTLIPSHGYLHRIPGAHEIGSVPFYFRGGIQVAGLFEVPGKTRKKNLHHYVLHHPWMEAYDRGSGRHLIYVHDGSGQPFYTDSNRFACFSAAVAAAVTQGFFGQVAVLHLHDWHTALIALLRHSDPACAALKKIRTVYSIHNLGIQGIRPISGSDASLEAWFPGMPYAWIDVADPNNPACVNLMATGIRLADKVHTVSPAYAEEITHPSRKPHFYGAEGLERVIAYARNGGRLSGILNGCPEINSAKGALDGAVPWTRILQRELLHWTAGHSALPAGHFTAFERLALLEKEPHEPRTLLTTVGRAVDQKMLLLRERGSNGRTALEQILEALGPHGLWIVLAAGDPDYEAYLAWTAARYDNFIFLNGYSETCADLLYAKGHLFVMPSSYEPCGISQLLAMRNGSPCIVHGVGGLRDTVQDRENGFVFQGWTLSEQVDRFAATAIEAIDLQRSAGPPWRTMCRKAAAVRFEWRVTARAYLDQLYGQTDNDHQ